MLKPALYSGQGVVPSLRAAPVRRSQPNAAVGLSKRKIIMSLPAKLPHPSRYCIDEEMTEKDWEEYFANRKKYDKPVSREETEQLLIRGAKLLNTEDEKEFNELSSRIPALPAWALAVKDARGFKMISDWNLYEAKKVFPNEF